jgi:DNA transformation protein
VTARFEGFVAELFEGLGPVGVRKMFGGLSISAEGVQFALSLDAIIYLKTDESLAAALKQAGSTPFVYQSARRSVTLGYWRLPEGALDDPDEACAWARKALAIAKAGKTSKRPKRNAT